MLQDLSPANFIVAEYNGWHYFSKNLSTVDFLATAWKTGVTVEWQVSILFGKFGRVMKVLALLK
jgi:hypothetical protein